jgi:SPP1 gp7 family putative phage head morphogenesis protein
MVAAVHGGMLREGQIDEKVTAGLAEFLGEGLLAGVALEEGLGLAEELAAAITENIATFAAFKNHSNIVALMGELVDEKGRVKSLSRFRKDAAPLVEQYNKNWLAAEYDTTLASGQAAVKWQEVQANKDLYPYLKFDAVRDASTSAVCNALEGVCRPVGDPFWNTHYPPLHWRCRSTVRPADEREQVTPTRETDAASKRANVPPAFQNNPGKSGEVFNEDHPYFDVSEKVKAEITKRVPKVQPSKAKAPPKVNKKVLAKTPNFEEAQQFIQREGLLLKYPMLDKLEAGMVTQYTGISAGRMNLALRGGRALTGVEEQIKLLDSALAKMPKRAGVSWRAVPIKPHLESLPDSYVVGKTVKEPAYVSTSISRKYFSESTSPNIFYKITGKSGVNIIEFSDVVEESEILYPRGLTFEVISKEQAGNSWYIELREI